MADLLDEDGLQLQSLNDIVTDLIPTGVFKFTLLKLAKEGVLFFIGVLVERLVLF